MKVSFVSHRHVWRIYYDITDVEFELISSFWPSLPADIQAAYENPKDKMLVFKGNFFPSQFLFCLWMSKLVGEYFGARNIIFMRGPDGECFCPDCGFLS